MIELQCAICGSTDLVPGKYVFTFHCNGCDRDLALYEIKYVTIAKETKDADRAQSIAREFPIIPTARKW